MPDSAAVIDWLLDPRRSDFAIRWQVLRDLLDAPENDWRAERARVETHGWGARLRSPARSASRGRHVPLDWSPTGQVWFDVDDGQGEPSRWVTLRALRVLRWWEA